MHKALSALTSVAPGPTDATDPPAPGPGRCACTNGTHNTPGSYVHDAVQVALRELAHDHDRVGPLAEISAVASSAHRIGRGTPEDTDTHRAATTPNGLPVKRCHRRCDQSAAASEAGARMGQLAAQSEAITSAFVSADQPGGSERLIEDAPARITRDAQHLLSVTARTERMIFLLQESQRSEIEHDDDH